MQYAHFLYIYSEKEYMNRQKAVGKGIGRRHRKKGEGIGRRHRQKAKKYAGQGNRQ